MGYISRIKGKLRVRSSGASSTEAQGTSAKDLPLDHQLTFNRGNKEQWKYKDGRVFVNEVDIEDVVEFDNKDVGLWCAVSEALVDYKNEVTQKGSGDHGNFFARIDAVQGRIMCNMKRYFDEKMLGFSFSFENGEVLFNNFNVRAFIAMYHLRPTEKARQFLFGLKAKLTLIMMSKNVTSHDRVQRVIQRLYDEVVDALSVSPIEVRCLPAAGSDRRI